MARPPTKPQSLIPGWMLAAFLIAATLMALFPVADGVDSISYSQFETLLAQDKVAKVTVAGDTLRGELREAPPSGNKKFITQRVPADLAAELGKHNVEFNATASETGL